MHCLVPAKFTWLGYQEINIGIDNKEALSALSNMSTWPRYRSLLERIMGLKSCFRTLMFQQVSVMSNSIVRDIARSVLRDGMFQSYLALGSPAWLHNMIQDEAHTKVFSFYFLVPPLNWVQTFKKKNFLMKWH